MQVLERGGIYSSLPDVLRVKAKLMLAAQADQSTKALGILQQSIDHASSQQAKSSVMKSLLVQVSIQPDKAKRAASLEQLSILYKQFREGFETEDLRLAKQLIQSPRC